ncbi:uncharacterized protein LOC110024643 isoform X2 [Phalaenopsis equestris]|uniref:uncharacterized protein LOC110024643 isoform X2 n=1 Tax=Phalaenopsis equestris TaxID=78828 RepID=UPI0009E2C6A5|nr:uncharacterized protein LOC110024643 isoform X2 [Phalaenopsis equestris]
MEVVGASDEGSKIIHKRTSCFEVLDGVPILTFDPSVENFLAIMEVISELCNETKEESFETSEIERFNSMIVFVREWKQFYFCEWMPFHCKSKTVNFTYQTESAEAKDAINGIKLPQFSSAAVPKNDFNLVDKLPSTGSTFENDDFVLHVGGSVWAMDWCPRLYENIGCDVKCEYLAIAAHPTGSEYHKIGEQLTGRGFIQIWCFLHLVDKEESLNPKVVRRRREHNKKGNEDSCVPKCSVKRRTTAPSIPDEIIEGSNIAVIDGPYGPFSLRENAISNECCMSNEFYTNEELKNSYSAGNLGGNKQVFDYIDNPIDEAGKSRGRPRKSSDANTPRPRGRPRKYPISSSNESGVIHGDQHSSSLFTTGDIGTLSRSSPISIGNYIDKARNSRGRPRKSSDAKTPRPRGRPRKYPILSSNGCGVTHDDKHSSSLFTTGDIGTLSRSNPISVGSCIENFQKGINGVSDLNEQGETLPCSVMPIHDVCSQFHVDNSDIPQVSFLPPGSNAKVGSFSSGLRRYRESSIPSEHSIVQLSQNLLTLPTSTVSETSRKGVVTEKASKEVFKDVGCGMESCLTDWNSEVNDGAIIIYDDNDQAIKTNGSSPIRENHYLEGSVLPSHVDDCQKIVAVTENLVQDHSFIPEVDINAKLHLGYLAVLLGNGSLEVWEVPVHGLVKLLYTGCHSKGTDPRFLKLQPVFKCSKLKFGQRQSIPLALEWSPSASRDLILAGCHDGTVALWKFCSKLSSEDTKPLLCFTADTVPIRSLAWAPDDSDVECSNLIVTAGHEGLKFWDLRDPYRPLLDLCPVQRAVLSLDWLKNPSCLVIAYEDGIIRTLSLTKIANDIPATGEPLATKQQGLHFQSCSSFAIWSVQVSRSTGFVAYCGSDGRTCYFQLTAEAVDKGSSRYRKPHFLCGSLAEDGPTLAMNTPLKSVPLPKQPLASKVVADEAKPINSSMPANNTSSQKKRKCNPSKQAEAGEDGALQETESRGDESRQNITRFPPKIVAMHKLRWNMNKGSERWLCYGGAAGIVRCQLVSPR